MILAPCIRARHFNGIIISLLSFETYVLVIVIVDSILGSVLNDNRFLARVIATQHIATAGASYSNQRVIYKK